MTSWIESAPVEVTTRYATTVPDLPAAWVFIMAKVDTVGPRPRIEISPLSAATVQSMIDGESLEWSDAFEVVVEGMSEEPK
jgi:hypothetical protein